MDINNNQLTNTFLKGMNTDTSDMLLGPELYREAVNLRLSTNTDLNTGELHMIEGTILWSNYFLDNNILIKKLCSIRNYIVVIGSSTDTETIDGVETPYSYWNVYVSNSGPDSFTNVTNDIRKTLGDNINTVLNWESSENVYMYIADGVNPIMKVSLTDTGLDYNDIISYTDMYCPTISASLTTGGQMLSGRVLYSYLIYKKHGTISKMSPISKAVYIYKDGTSVSGSEGYNYEEISNKSVSLSINFGTVQQDIYLKIYRIHYMKKNEVPTITLIYDNIAVDNFIDTGVENTQTYSLAEYTALSNVITIVPKLIELKDNYLFAANNKEYNTTDDWFDAVKNNVLDYFEITLEFLLFNNPSTTNQCRTRTFRRGEKYLFGVILYDKNGNKSNVIRLPECTINNSNVVYDVSNSRLNVPLIKLSIKQAKLAEVVQKASKVELVMAERTIDVKNTLYQGIIGRTLKGWLNGSNYVDGLKYSNRVCPSGFMSLMNINHTRDIVEGRDWSENYFEPSQNVFLFVSPEVLYQEEDTNSIFKQYKSLLSIETATNYRIEYRLSNSDGLLATTERTWTIKSDSTLDNNFKYFSRSSISDQNSGQVEDLPNMKGRCIPLDDFLDLVGTNKWKVHFVGSVLPTLMYLAIQYVSSVQLLSQGADPATTLIEYKFIGLTHVRLISNGEEMDIPLSVYESYANMDPVTEFGMDGTPYVLFSNIKCHPSMAFRVYTYETTAVPALSGKSVTLVGDNNTYISALPFTNNSAANSGNSGSHPEILYLNYVDRYLTMLTLLNDSLDSLNSSQPVLFNSIKINSRYDINPSYISVNAGNILDVCLYNLNEIKQFSRNEGDLRILEDSIPIGEYEYIPWTVPYTLTFNKEHLVHQKTDIGPIKMNAFLRQDDFKWVFIDASGLYSGALWTSHSWLGSFNLAYPVSTSGKCMLINIKTNNSGFDYKYNDVGEFLPITVVNIKKNAANYPEDPVYYSHGDVIDIATGLETIYASGGDTFIQFMEYNAAHVVYEPYYYNMSTMSTVYQVPLETDIDISSEHGTSYTKQGNRWQIQDIPVAIPGYTQKESCYKYNPIYGYINNISSSFEKYDDKKEIDKTDCRIYASQKKELGEIIDSWLTFKAADFIDLDTNRGEITALTSFKNQLVAWLNNATAVVGVNERALVTSTTDTNIILGTGDLLSRYDYISDIYGMIPDTNCFAKSDTTLYWYDRDNREILAYGGGQSVIPLSTTKNIKSHLNESARPYPRLIYDPLYKELLANVATKTIVYSEQMQCFTGLYKFDLLENTTIDNYIYLLNYQKIYSWNHYTTDIETDSTVAYLYDVPATPSLKYVVNRDPMYNKTFDICIIGGRLVPVTSTLTTPATDEEKQKVQDLTGKYHKSNLNPISMSFSTPLNQSANINNIDFTTINEYDFRMCVPRDKQTTSTIPEYGNRMKGKVMNCEIRSSSNSVDFSLQYITTKYRMSWS